MPFDGSGTYIPLTPPTYPAVAGEVIYAARFNAVMQDVFDALTASLKRDGSASALEDFNINGFKVIGAVAAAAAGNYVEYQQWIDSFVAPDFGSPTSDSPSAADDSTRLATTEWVRDIIAAAAAASLPAQAGKVGKTLRTDGTTAEWLDLFGTSTILTATPGANLVARTDYGLNSNTAAFTVTLPTSPTDKDWVRLADLKGVCSTKNVTVGRNGQNINGLSEDFIIDLDFFVGYFVFNTSYGWTVQ